MIEVCLRKKNQFISDIPNSPGIYGFIGEQSETIYIGKAKNLRRRLSQYQNAKRIKKHKKMKTILKQAISLKYEICQTHLDAEILETQLIQRLRPKYNQANAFFFCTPSLELNHLNRNFHFATQLNPNILGSLNFMDVSDQGLGLERHFLHSDHFCITLLTPKGRK